MLVRICLHAERGAVHHKLPCHGTDEQQHNNEQKNSFCHCSSKFIYFILNQKKTSTLIIANLQKIAIVFCKKSFHKYNVYFVDSQKINGVINILKISLHPVFPFRREVPEFSAVLFLSGNIPTTIIPGQPAEKNKATRKDGNGAKAKFPAQSNSIRQKA